MVAVDPVLSELRARLDRHGYVVVPHGDHLCVRLALFSSVRVYDRGGRIELKPRFGPLGRTGGLLATSVIATVAVAAIALAEGPSPLTAIVAFAGVVGLAHDACRFVVTRATHLIDNAQVLARCRKAGFDVPERGATVPEHNWVPSGVYCQFHESHRPSLVFSPFAIEASEDDVALLLLSYDAQRELPRITGAQLVGRYRIDENLPVELCRSEIEAGLNRWLTETLPARILGRP